ncbi:MAG: hypothetical protein B2I17_08195 [Thermoplasmatales archaeon B_DKE]|nr:MAG: hypothetical protein B2I17_08195 [Thermoplasmatales archaeon B_DKE]
MARSMFSGITIMAGRLFYSMNWYNVSPALGDISSTYHIPFSLTGLILAVFLLGAGVFQIPAGIIATKIGSRNTSVLGLVLMSLAVLGSALSPTFLLFVVMRLITGIGAAFFFSSAIGVLSDIYYDKLPEMVGLYNGFFSIGAGIGIFAFIPLIDIFGWQNSLLISGTITLVSALAFFIIVPKGERGGQFDVHKIKSRILDRRIWYISLGFSGFWALNFTLAEYFKTFAESFGFSVIVAGLMGSAIMFLGIVGGILTGFFRRGRPIRTSVVLTLFLSMSLLLLMFNSAYTLWTVVALNGVFAVVIFSLQYTAVIRLDSDRLYIPLNVGLMNSLQLGFGSLVPLVFAFLIPYGYSISWAFLALLSVVTLPMVYMFRIRK